MGQFGDGSVGGALKLYHIYRVKVIKRIGYILLIIPMILGISVAWLHYALSPDYEGEQPLKSLTDEVKAYYDEYGIPHIYADNEKDAFLALGYVHAQDRLWQMEVLRRIGRGGLSEVFGKELIATDKFFLALGIDDASEHTVSTLDLSTAAAQLAQAYLDGINQFVEEGPTPLEFYLTGIEKEPFVLKDIYNTIGYMAFSFAMAHKTDPLLTDIKNTLGTEYLEDLERTGVADTLRIKSYSSDSTRIISSAIPAKVVASLEKLGIPLFEGSNAWVLAPEKTENGKVLFANDPHIGFSQPSVWYEAHLQTPTYEKYGYHLAGVPFPLLGHDRKLAYGMTMFENDDVDFYFVDGHPSDSTQYKTINGWSTYDVVSKTIKVKDAEKVHFSYKKTIYGPVMNGIADQIRTERPMAMWWLYTQHENKVMDALFGMSHAQNISEFEKALPNVHAPGLNIMYGDAADNIAWWATAKLYRIPDSVDTKVVYEEGQGLPVDKEFLNFSENPQAINPPWNYVYSANNQPDSIAGMLYPGYYLPENRAKRIVQLLEPKDDWNLNSVSEMMVDVTSPVNTSVVSDLVKLMDVEQLTDDQIKALDIINMWPGEYSLESRGSTIYHRWLYYFLKATFEDELGKERFEQFLGTHFFKKQIAPMAAKENSVWWDDVTTPDVVETKPQLVQAAFVRAVESLESDLGKDQSRWTWNRVHSLEHGHPIGRIAALRSFFNVGPFPVSGTREVINNMAFPYDESGFYNVSSGPSTRRVIDFSDVENSVSILPTGQSGNPLSPHYRDQAKMFVNGQFRKMMMNKEEILRTSKSLLTFRPVQEREE